MTHKYTFSFLSITSDKEKCIDQLPDIPALRGHLKAGAGHPGLAPDISRQVPDIPGAGHPRCRTSRPCAGHLKAGAGHPRCRTSQVPDIPGAGHPGLAPDISRQVPDISRQVPDIPAKRWTS